MAAEAARDRNYNFFYHAAPVIYREGAECLGAVRRQVKEFAKPKIPMKEVPHDVCPDDIAHHLD